MGTKGGHFVDTPDVSQRLFGYRPRGIHPCVYVNIRTVSEVFWTAVFGAGIFQGIFLGASVILRPRSNRLVGRFLSAALALFSLGLLAEVVQGALDEKTALYIAFLNINTELAFGPLIFLTIRSILFPDRECSRRDILHFLPITLGMIFWSVAWFYVVDPAALYQTGFHSELPVFEYLIFKAGVLFAYLATTYRLLARAAVQHEWLYSGNHSVRIETVQHWAVGLSAIPAFIYLISIAESIGFEFRVGSDQIGGLLLAALIFLIGWLFVSRPWVLSLKPQPLEIESRHSDANLLSAYLREGKPWLDPCLSRSQLAAAFGWTESRLSLAIGFSLNSSFYGLLNQYRLAEFERLADDPSRREDIVLTLAFDSGFNSKAVFYRAFRNKHRTTPTRFRNELLTNPSVKASL